MDSSRFIWGWVKVCVDVVLMGSMPMHPSFEMNDFGIEMQNPEPFEFSFGIEEEPVQFQPYVPGSSRNQLPNNEEYVVLPRAYLEKLKVPPCMLNSSVPFLGDCPYMQETNNARNDQPSDNQKQWSKLDESTV